MSFYDLEQVFTEQTEFRIRTEKGVIKDKIYAGVFRKTLWNSGIGTDLIKNAIKEGVIEEVQFAPEGRTVRVGYIWLEKELRQVSPYKKVFSKLPEIWAEVKRKIRRFVRTWLTPRF